MTEITLTPEQRAIVQHEHGPAVVFAVAGSGKTTAMVHRIERLVREEVFEPQRILATSFSRACVADLERELGRWPHCRPVDTRTLHALGLRLLREAPPGPSPVRPGSGGAIGSSGYELVTKAMRLARRRGVDWKKELDDLDAEDFLHYVGDCKGNLAYADLEAAELPPSAREVATQATAPDGLDHYLGLYRLYEEVRARAGVVTFDDMLMGGWEVLHRYPELLERAQAWYDCVIVDEFQDVNRAQHAIVAHLAAPQDDLMVVGDDDQTIYEWRGADPAFILGFEEAYDATTYRIEDTFRCPAPQVALANRVIAQNTQRVDKQLSLTRGFEGTLSIDGHTSEEKMGRAVVQQIQAHQARGMDLQSITILLRVYAQSAYIEHHLIDAGIPYRIEGSQPFYERSEVGALTAYLRLALHDARFLRDGTAPALDGHDLGDLICQVANACQEPRYISHEAARQAARACRQRNLTVDAGLRAAADEAPGYMARGMRRLAQDISWLRKGVFRRSAKKLLLGLDERVGYRAYLREHSGFDETGEGRARNITALIDYAEAWTGAEQLLEGLEALRKAHDRQQRGQDVVDIRTIHRAKGLEWPVVIVPHCNEGTLPFSRAFGETDRIEEERRLMYVALTRSKATTHLHHLEGSPLSRFLQDADHSTTLEAVDQVEELLARSPRGWQPEEALALVQHVHGLHLERYLERWWPASEHRKRSVARVARTVLQQARDEELLDRLEVPEDRLGVWEALAPHAELPPGGLGIELEGLLPEPEPDPEPEEPPTQAPELIVQLQRGVQVEHPQHGQGTVLEKKHVRGKKEVLVELESGQRVWVDLNEQALEVGAPEAQGSSDEALFEALRTVRLEQARDQGVPAFVVAHDATLERMVAARPTTEDELLAVKGIGPTFVERYSQAFLDVLRR